MKFTTIRRIALVSICIFVFQYLFVFATNEIGIVSGTISNEEPPSEENLAKKTSLYDTLKLKQLGLSQKAYDFAMNGYNSLITKGKIKNKEVLTIADFSLSSCKKRLFIIDLTARKLLFCTYVSHGRNSGKETASQFSNQDGSFKSSLGFYTTQETYQGKHGYSLRLNGEEKGINDNALSRGIVMHSAAYVNESLIRSQGFIGRSQGCPAVSEALHKSIIAKIKSGSCFFIYGTDKYYAAQSILLKQPNQGA